jgi:hypothetical protein
MAATVMGASGARLARAPMAPFEYRQPQNESGVNGYTIKISFCRKSIEIPSVVFSFL